MNPRNAVGGLSGLIRHGLRKRKPNPYPEELFMLDWCGKHEESERKKIERNEQSGAFCVTARTRCCEIQQFTAKGNRQMGYLPTQMRLGE